MNNIILDWQKQSQYLKHLEHLEILRAQAATKREQELEAARICGACEALEILTNFGLIPSRCKGSNQYELIIND